MRIGVAVAAALAAGVVVHGRVWMTSAAQAESMADAARPFLDQAIANRLLDEAEVTANDDRLEVEIVAERATAERLAQLIALRMGIGAGP